MSTSTFSLFFALLSLVALAGAVLVVVLWVGRRNPQLDAARRELAQVALPLAFVVAAVTTAGSLYYSKVVGYVPCELCWYQRIAMYPQVIVLGTALVRRDRGVRPYVIGPCLVGALISLYHSWIQAFPPESPTSFCTAEAPCTVRYVWELGFISLPFMALSAFLAIVGLMVAAGWAVPAAGEPVGETAAADPLLSETSS
jgi:disulfide bond formation protein DsbB